LVAPRLRALIRIADVDAVDQDKGRPSAGGVVRNYATKSQAGRSGVVRREGSGLIAAMERRHRFIDKSRAEGMGIV
jgi:hypothetical protein